MGLEIGGTELLVSRECSHYKCLTINYIASGSGIDQ